MATEDEVQRLLLQVQGAADVERLKEEIEKEEQALLLLNQQMKANPAAAAGLQAAAAASVAKYQQLTSEMKAATAAAGNLAGGHKNLTQTAMQATYMFQDFTGASGGLAQKLNSIQNNVPGLLAGFGVSGPIVAGLSAVAVVMGLIVNNWDSIAGAFTTRNPFPETADDVKRMEESLKKASKELEEMHKKTTLSADELARFNALTIQTTKLETDLAQARKERAFFKEAAEAPEPEDKQRTEAVKKFLIGQGKTFEESLEKVIRGSYEAAGQAITDEQVRAAKEEMKKGLVAGESGYIKRLLYWIDTAHEAVFKPEAVEHLAAVVPERIRAEKAGRQRIADFELREKQRKEAEQAGKAEEAELQARGEAAEKQRKAQAEKAAQPFAGVFDLDLERAAAARRARGEAEEKTRRELAEQVKARVIVGGVDPDLAGLVADEIMDKIMKELAKRAAAARFGPAPVAPAPPAPGPQAAVPAPVAPAPVAMVPAPAPTPESAGLPPAIAEEPAPTPTIVVQAAPPAPAVAPAMGVHEAIASALIGMVPRPVPAPVPAALAPPKPPTPAAPPPPRQSPLERLTEGTWLAGLGRSVSDGVASGIKAATTTSPSGPRNPYMEEEGEQPPAAPTPNILGRFGAFMGEQPRRPMVPFPGDRPAPAPAPPPAAPPAPPPPEEVGAPLLHGPGMFAPGGAELLFGHPIPAPPPPPQPPPPPEPPPAPPPVPGASVVPRKTTPEEDRAQRLAILTPDQLRAFRESEIRQDERITPIQVPPRTTPQQDEAKRQAALTDAQMERYEADMERDRLIAANRPAPFVGPPKAPPGPGTVEARIARGRARTEAKRPAPVPGKPGRDTVEARIAHVQQRRAAKAAQRREQLARRDRVKAGLPAIVPPTEDQLARQQVKVDTEQAEAARVKQVREAREREALARQVQRQTAAETGTTITPEEAREVAGKAQTLNKSLPDEVIGLMEKGYDAQEATLMAMAKAQQAFRAMEQRAAMHHRAARQLGQGFDSMREAGATALNFGGP